MRAALSILILTLFTNCGGNVLPNLPDGGSACAGLDETDCKKYSNCRADYGCPGSECEGATAVQVSGTFTQCDNASDPAPIYACPAIAIDCADMCSNLDAADCVANPLCQSNTCPNDCSDGGTTFVSCQRKTDPQQIYSCIALPCVPPIDCTQYTDAASCNANVDCAATICCGQFVSCGAASGGVVDGGIASGTSSCPSNCGDTCANLDEVACGTTSACHSVYQSIPVTCDTPGCQTEFSRCASGSGATCGNVQITCSSAPPYCESNDDYVVISYTNGCYEGCVKPTECQ